MLFLYGESIFSRGYVAFAIGYSLLLSHSHTTYGYRKFSYRQSGTHSRFTSSQQVQMKSYKVQSIENSSIKLFDNGR